MSNQDHAPLRIVGLLLAAGRSRRMGKLKQTLPWPPDHPAAKGSAARSTVVAAAFDAISSFCEVMLVAVGRDREAVLAALGERRFDAVDVSSDAPMFESIRAGLHAVFHQAHAKNADIDAVMLHPGDHPGVARSTIALLIQNLRLDPHRAALPEYRGKGGHPVLIPRALAAQVLAWNGKGGLRQFWIDHPDRCIRIAVDDASCIVDLDTPGDYAATVFTP